MKIKEINDKEIWEDFLLECQERTFLSSWNWGEFQKMMENKIWRLGVYDNNNLISTSLIVKIKARRGSFIFLPHGPSLAKAKKDETNIKYEILKILIEKLKEIAKEEKASFIRISPIWLRNEENIKVYQSLGFMEAPIHMHPELTWELDITTPEDKLLMQMRKTTRYLIRQAQKNPDVKIEKSPAFAKASVGKQELDDIEEFNELYQTTVDRHHFTPFSLNYLKNEVSIFLPDNEVMIFLGKYKDELIASAIIIFWQRTAFYHHGASSLKHPKIPASYLLQWEAIKEAKSRECRIYNFWGIAPSENPKHPWAGLSLFKKGFGGYKKEYVKTQDLPLSSKYLMNYLIEVLRRQKRRL